MKFSKFIEDELSKFDEEFELTVMQKNGKPFIEVMFFDFLALEREFGKERIEYRPFDGEYFNTEAVVVENGIKYFGFTNRSEDDVH